MNLYIYIYIYIFLNYKQHLLHQRYLHTANINNVFYSKPKYYLQSNTENGIYFNTEHEDYFNCIYLQSDAVVSLHQLQLIDGILMVLCYKQLVGNEDEHD